MKKGLTIFLFLLHHFCFAQQHEHDAYWNPNYRDSIYPLKAGFTLSFGMVYNNFEALNKNLRQNYVPELNSLAPTVDFSAEVIGIKSRFIYRYGGAWQHLGNKGKNNSIVFDGFSMNYHVGLRLFNAGKLYTYYLTGVDLQANLITIKGRHYKTQTPSFNLCNAHTLDLRYMMNKKNFIGTSFRTGIPLYRSDWQHYYQLYGEYPIVGSFVFQTLITWSHIL